MSEPAEGEVPGRRVAGGWGFAAIGAVATAAGVGALSEGLAFVLYALSVARGGTVSVVAAARTGELLFFAIHHAGLVFDVPEFHPLLVVGATGPAVATTVALALAPLAGTAVVGALLYRAGRSVARRVGGTAWERAAHGAKVAPAYAVLCLALSYVVRLQVVLAPNGVVGGRIQVHAGHLGAFLWPLGLALVFGAAGGLRSAGEPVSDGDVGTKPLVARAALSGGWRMLWAGEALAFAGLLVLAAVKPHATADYFSEAFRGGAARGTAEVVLTGMVVPNMAAWVLYPSMGACTGVFGAVSDCVLSYTRFPAAGSLARVGQPGPAHGPPAAYFAFLLVPLVAVLLGGALAARRARAQAIGEAARAGAAAGLVFAGFSLGLVALADVVVRIGAGASGGAEVLRLGPDLVTGPLQALLWGVVGGALGGLARHVRSGRRPDGADHSEGSDGP